MVANWGGDGGAFRISAVCSFPIMLNSLRQRVSTGNWINTGGIWVYREEPSKLNLRGIAIAIAVSFFLIMWCCVGAGSAGLNHRYYPSPIQISRDTSDRDSLHKPRAPPLVTRGRRRAWSCASVRHASGLTVRPVPTFALSVRRMRDESFSRNCLPLLSE